MNNELSNEEQQAILDLYHFYHTIEVRPGVATKGIKKFAALQQPVTTLLHSLVLQNKEVLDVGCRDGLFSFQAEQQGAARVVGVDNDLSTGAVKVLIPLLRSRVTMLPLNIYQLSPAVLGNFDLVICAGVLYHLRFPFLAFQIFRTMLRDGGSLLLETAIVRGHNNTSILFCPSGEDSPYEQTSVSFFNRKGLLDTLSSFGFAPIEHRILHSRRKSRPDRITLLCTYNQDKADPNLETYWLNLHSNHTNGAPSHRL